MLTAVLLWIAVAAGATHALNNGLGLTPQMGWNSWLVSVKHARALLVTCSCFVKEPFRVQRERIRYSFHGQSLG